MLIFNNNRRSHAQTYTYGGREFQNQKRWNQTAATVKHMNNVSGYLTTY